ncbi:hypothetical protein [Nonomuraea typhae]|uniref:Uncharacterized protein n=1 Tax=Nonomuraea typhae TaxID=2603600 RepID=A0ABW7Z8M9_9ACTN
MITVKIVALAAGAAAIALIALAGYRADRDAGLALEQMEIDLSDCA